MPDDTETEALRMDAVRRYDILDTPPDRAFDRLTGLAARAFDTPIAIVSIVDTDRIWFKSHHGLDVEEIGRDPGLCASAILQDGPWLVEDARIDPRTLANPLVAGDFGLGFYLGVPLTTSDGHNLGTLCVLDFEPRQVHDQQVADLVDLASIVIDELELRRSARDRVLVLEDQRHLSEELARVLQESLLPPSLPAIEGIELAARYVPAQRERVGGDFYDAWKTDAGAVLLVGDVMGHGPKAAALTSMARHMMLALAAADRSPSASLTTLNHAIRVRQAGDPERRFCTVAAVRVDRAERGWSATVSLAGHPLPLLVHADGTIEEIGTPRPLLGWLEQPGYDDITIELRTGDSLVLYTDGLTDAHPGAPNVADGSFVRLLAAVADRPPGVIADSLLEAVIGRTPTPRDDIAILVAQLRPAS